MKFLNYFIKLRKIFKLRKYIKNRSDVIIFIFLFTINISREFTRWLKSIINKKFKKDFVDIK